MEGNIYNNITKEINFNLPDINFDSDSDDFVDGEPIKPYIRPPADVLFGTDDSESEEILNMLSKLPHETYHEQNNNLKNEPKPPQSIDNSNNKLLNRELPFNDIKLSYDIEKYSLVNSEKITKEITLSKFGIRDNIDLDKVLEEIDLSNSRTTFFDDVLLMDHSKELESNNDLQHNELMKKLDDISKQYENKSINKCKNNDTNLIRDTSNNNDKNNNCYYFNDGINGKDTVSLASLLDKVKQESTRQTTYLDLRLENQLSFQPLSVEIKQNVSDQDSSDESDKEELNANPDLWIDNYRKFKNNQTQNLLNKVEVTKKPVVKEGSSSETRSIEDEESEKHHNDTFHQECIKTVECNVQQTRNKNETVPEHVQMKIDKIKLKEKMLSDRRNIAERFQPFIQCSNIVPALIHEEVSFSPFPSCPLIPEIDLGSETQFFNAFIALQSPHFIMTISKVSTPLSLDHAKENFIFLLSLILRAMGIDSSPGLPFRVLGLQQIHYENKLQLAMLCSTDISLTKMRSDLKNMTLANLSQGTDDQVSMLSTLPLTHIFRIQPYDVTLNGNIWNLTSASIIWHQMSDNRHHINETNIGSRPLNINTSCVVFQKDLYFSSNLDRLLEIVLERFTLVGLRYFLNDNKSNDGQIILALRGFDAINTMNSLLNTSSYKGKVSCTRFQESSLKDLCKFFGPSLDEKRMQASINLNLCHQLANELSFGPDFYQSLYWTQSSDIALFVSPLCLDIGWILNIMQNSGGYVLINISRLNLSVSKGRQIGIPERSIDYFDSKNGVCHLIIMRNENPLHPLPFILKQCVNFMTNQEPVHLDYEKFFFASAYSDFLINIVDIHKSFQTPEVRELSCDVMEPPYEDCEQIAFVLIISDELTRHVGQILDLMTNLDLLAVKCFSNNINTDHMSLLKSQFNLRLPQLSQDALTFSENESELQMRIGVFVVRSMYMIRELDKIYASVKTEKNLVFAYTLTSHTTFRMIGSFFTSSELVCDPRRRSCLQFLPESIISNLDQRKIIAQIPLLHSPIETVLSIRISNSSSVLQKFRKIWFLLTRDDFKISMAVLDENRQLHFIVSRPNAIFYLAQWTKHHFGTEEDVKFVTKPNEMKTFLSQISQQSTGLQFSLNAINDHSTGVDGLIGENSDFIYLLINCDLLQSTGEILTQMKIFWTFLDDNNYICHSLSIVNINTSLICKLNYGAFLNFCGQQMKKKGQYLCLLLTANMAAFVTGDLIKSKFDLNKCNQQIYENIYYNSQPQQISQCCHILWDDVIYNYDIVK